MFVLTPGMSIEVEFDYDAPPVDGGRTVDLLEDDQPAYPRDATHLPPVEQSLARVTSGPGRQPTV
jgi:hypothetical protein